MRIFQNLWPTGAKPALAERSLQKLYGKLTDLLGKFQIIRFQMDEKRIALRHLVHKGKPQISLVFPKDRELNLVVKTIGAEWSGTPRCWYLRNNPQNVKKIFAAAKGKAWIDGKEFFKGAECC
ncbi:MAG: hypothetical protein WD077_13075 [Bacteroidia bacterium]